jgi:DNA modification methylase
VWSVAGKHGQTHRLICADATEPAAYARLLGRDRVTLTFTSPPYNAGTSETLSNNSHTTDSKYVLGAGDDLNVSDYLGLLSAFTQCALDVSDWALVNLQMLAGNKIALVEYLFAFRHRLADIAIWDKGASQPAMAERVMNSDYEYLLMFSRREHPSRAFGNKPFRGTVSNVVDIAPQRHNPYPELIAATMPDELPVWALSTFTSPGDGILDPFAGSGTTIVACEQMGRTGYGIELVPAHLAATLDRLSQLGLEPIREDSA